MQEYNGFISLNSDEVIEKIKQDAILIDIRLYDEWVMTGIIENSHCITAFNMFGSFEEKHFMEKFNEIVKDKDTPFILICARANRTKVLANYLSKLGYTQVFELDRGITVGWISEGKEVFKYEE